MRLTRPPRLRQTLAMTESFASTGGVRLWTTASGEGIPVVLCSGGPGCCDYLAPVASMLEGDARVIRFEARGCGRSDHAESYTVETCLEDLEAVRDHYRIERWIVAGHSWGADLALAYALRYPERTLGLVCLAGGRMNNDREWHRLYSEGRDQGLEPPLEFDYPPNLDVNAQVNRSMKEYIQRPGLFREIARLDRPALFLYGSRDIRPSWPVEQVANLLPGAEFRLLDGADHHLWLTHAEEVGEHVRAFVGRLG